MSTDYKVPTIEAMLADMDKAFAVMHRHVKPRIIDQARQTLANGHGEVIYRLFNEIGGDTVSLTAGTLPYAGAAVTSFIEAQAYLFVLNRDYDKTGQPIEDVLKHHEQTLFNWVRDGVISRHPDCDLSKIARDVLVTEFERLSCPATALSLSIVRTLRHFLSASFTPTTRH